MSELPSFMRPSQVRPAPSFLLPSKVEKQHRAAERELSLDRFALAFPRVLDRMYSGETLNNILRDFPLPIERGAFMRWIKKDAKRFADYTLAKETRTEIWTGNMLSIAEGVEDNMELDRAKFLVDTYKWLVSSENKKGYGKSTQIEVNGNISIVAALGAAETRVEQIAAFEDDDENEPTMAQLKAPVEAEWEEADED